jgi:pimeloyl-ACP methyl ester carboxylesterase
MNSMLIEKNHNTGEALINYAEGPCSGSPVVFLHGLTDRWQYFLPIIPFISLRWHVYALDFRGHGKSSRTPPYRYLDHINDAIHFLENNVKLESVLFGSSMGGMVSLMVAAKRPDLVKAVVFGDSSIKTDRTRRVMVDYHSYWAGWRKLAGFNGSFEELVQLVADMPVNVPGQTKRKYGEGLDTINLMNKANYLRHLDPQVLDDWAMGGSNLDAFERVTKGYDEKLLGDIQCPVLLIQGNPRKGGIFTDDAVEFAISNIPKTYHVYIDEYDHNLGLYDWNTDKLLQSVNVFLETLK